MRIYVAGPYAKGDVAVNVRNAILAGDELVKRGHSPYIPHLTHLWHLLFPHPQEFWYHQDNQWLPLCDAVFRLPGESVGADAEVELAKSLCIPVYYSMRQVPELETWEKAI